ncbi:hypothetical protein M569_07089, partial [Genlisea aurea]
EARLKSLLCRMIWGFGLSCIAPRRRRLSAGVNGKALDGDNKAWLLAESGGIGDGNEPHSVHSSFRFSICCSQVELEEKTRSSSSSHGGCSSTTVLMVNLDSGALTESYPKWSRIESLERSISPAANSLIRFSFSDILSMTNKFSQGKVLGRGALSCVFRGRFGLLRTSVAIKRLDKDDKELSKAFCRELMIASSLHNPYIVPLLGYCIDPENGLFLVYKYVSGGSLDQLLHGVVSPGVAFSSWSIRYKVAVGVAEAINYMHNGTDRCAVHRDIKPSNILLSSKKIPKLCDFGLASWTPAPSVPFLCKTVKGTFGYLAPEYFQHGKVSDKTDVYAFGVVLLELITGRKPIETSRGPGEENLVSWAKPFLYEGGGGSSEKLLDPRLKSSSPKDSSRISCLVKAARACVSNDEAVRPGAGEILEILRGGGEFSSRRRRAALPDNSCETMKNHFALAMLGVEFDENDD